MRISHGFAAGGRWQGATFISAQAFLEKRAPRVAQPDGPARSGPRTVRGRSYADDLKLKVGRPSHRKMDSKRLQGGST